MKPSRFQKGKSGNPAGRPPKLRVHSVRALVDRHLPELVARAVDLAKLGDKDMLSLLLGATIAEEMERVVPTSLASPTNASVYVFSTGDHVKVGLAQDVQARWNDMRVGNPALLPPIYSSRALPRDVAATLERAAQDALAPHRVSGEWFKCSEEHAVDVVRRLEAAP